MIASHDAIMSQAIRTTYGGEVFKPRATPSTPCSRQPDGRGRRRGGRVQRASEPPSLGTTGPIYVRAAHGPVTGEGEQGGDNYVAMAVTGRPIMCAAGPRRAGDTSQGPPGGWCGRAAKGGMSLRDLGEHRLKDLARAPNAYSRSSRPIC